MMDNYEPRMVVGTKYKKLPNPDCGNCWGKWDPEKHTVEDSAFGFIVMKNGATIQLESSWALNILDPIEASTLLCGTKAGAQMKNQKLILNYDKDGELCEEEPDLTYHSTMKLTAAEAEARQWIDAILSGRAAGGPARTGAGGIRDPRSHLRIGENRKTGVFCVTGLFCIRESPAILRSRDFSVL